MSKIPGIEKAELQALPRISDRLSFLYLEHCIINRCDGAIAVSDRRGTVHVPAAVIGVLLLGPGSNITHRAVELLGDAGTTIIWVGERGVRYYAHGRALSRSSRLLERQAALVSNVRSRIAVARHMYQMRFPDEDVSTLTMQQLRGHEGARVRSVYRAHSKRTGVAWEGRKFVFGDITASNDVNRALSIGNACLYGAVHSVIVALGCAAGLGFIHCGHERSFVYDIADLYKAELTIPLAFDLAAEKPKDLERAVRLSLRDKFFETKFLERAARDIKSLLQSDDFEIHSQFETLNLWDNKCGTVESRTNHAADNKDMDTFESFDAEGYGEILKDDE
jgi:CRISPR-associated protein Cas1